jgi:4-aminobutyrate aminotransferase-like enzyme
MRNKILPSWGETPDIQRAIPIAMKKNPHRWMFFIDQAYHGKSITSSKLNT